jgi:hypothetical protein
MERKERKMSSLSVLIKIPILITLGDMAIDFSYLFLPVSLCVLCEYLALFALSFLEHQSKNFSDDFVVLICYLSPENK